LITRVPSRTARDQLVLTTGSLTGTDIDLVGAPSAIGHHYLAQLPPARRIRTKARIVIRAISHYNARGPAIDRTPYKATNRLQHAHGQPLTPSPLCMAGEPLTP